MSYQDIIYFINYALKLRLPPPWKKFACRSQILLQPRKFFYILIEPRFSLHPPTKKALEYFKYLKGLVRCLNLEPVRRESKKKFSLWMTIILQWLGLVAGDEGYEYLGTLLHARGNVPPLFHPSMPPFIED